MRMIFAHELKTGDSILTQDGDTFLVVNSQPSNIHPQNLRVVTCFSQRKQEYFEFEDESVDMRSGYKQPFVNGEFI